MRNTARQTRDNRTITIDFHDETTYFKLLDDRRACVEFVLAFLLALGFQLTHKAACGGGGCLTATRMTCASVWGESPSGASSARRAKRCSPSCRMSSGASARCDPRSLAMR